MLRLGDEFCERLLPTEGEITAEIGRGTMVTLVTPPVTDSGIERIRNFLRLLPDGADVVVNDWGVLRMMREEFPALKPVAGRLLCRMTKDPRVPRREGIGGFGFETPHFLALLQRYGVERMEIDLPPHARAEDFRSVKMKMSVHAPDGYVATGRMCRIGALGQEKQAKFWAGHECQKECLTYRMEMRRNGKNDPRTFQRGNTVFYERSGEMRKTLSDLADKGVIDRIVRDDIEDRCAVGERGGDGSAGEGGCR